MASFDDLFGDVEKVKDQLYTGQKVPIAIDENTIFQYLEDAGNVPNRVQIVCNRLKTEENNEISKKRKRNSSSSSTSDDFSPGGNGNNKMFDRLQEMFPHFPARYLKDRARRCGDADFQEVVEALLAGDVRQALNDKSVVIFDEESSIENSLVNETSDALDEDNVGNEMADTSLSEEELEPLSLQARAGGDNIQQNYQTLVNILPNVDPEFLLERCWDIGEDHVALEDFIESSLEDNSKLPSKKEYENRKSNQEEEHKIKSLTVSQFLEMWDDPHAYFGDTKTAVSDLYKKHAVFQLRKMFPSIHGVLIEKALEESNHHFIPTLKKVQKLPTKKGKKKQTPIPKRPSEMDFTFLKEYIYSKLESKIRQYQAWIEAKHNKAVEVARKTGSLFECQCCFDGDCLLTEVAMCEEGHMFCKECIRRGAGVQIGDQKTGISCLTQCDASFSLAVLKVNLSATVFSRLLQRQQLEEVQAAGLEDLVQCPACNFATIMPDPLDKVVRCRNPECGKESCRLCQENNHIPLTCDEVEKDSDVADRVKLENAMTDAMLRTCVDCHKKFFKEDGCNKMKCSCGATMCYICRKSVEDNYSHFYGQGLDPQNGKCPLWSDNKNLHKDEVFKAASKVKKELNKKVKNDPTNGIERPPEGFNPNGLHNVPQPEGFNQVNINPRRVHNPPPEGFNRRRVHNIPPEGFDRRRHHVNINVNIAQHRNNPPPQGFNPFRHQNQNFQPMGGFNPFINHNIRPPQVFNPFGHQNIRPQEGFDPYRLFNIQPPVGFNPFGIHNIPLPEAFNPNRFNNIL